MHHQPNPGRPEGGPPGPDEVERRLLLELVVDPPPEGDRLSDLAARLDASPRAMTAAASALEEVGLAVLDDDVVHASRAARRFDALWPISL